MGSLIRSRAATCRGYTLVELLVVAVIVGIVASAAALAWRTDPLHLLQSEADRLARQLELAQARVRIAGNRLAFSATAHSYSFWIRDDSGIWREIGDDDALKPKRLDERLSIHAISAAGIPVALGQRVGLAAHDPVLLSVALHGQGSRAIVQSSAFDGRMDVRIGDGPRLPE
jgi:type II secretion system protein H